MWEGKVKEGNERNKLKGSSSSSLSDIRGQKWKCIVIIKISRMGTMKGALTVDPTTWFLMAAYEDDGRTNNERWRKVNSKLISVKKPSNE